VWQTVWEHPVYGELTCTWTWRESSRGLATPTLIALQPDLLCPPEEVEELVRLVREDEDSFKLQGWNLPEN